MDNKNSEPIIESVAEQVSYLILQRHRKKTIAILVLCIVISIAGFLIPENPIPGVGIAGGIIFGYYQSLYWAAKNSFMKSFAHHNNLLYSDSGLLSSVTGRLFDLGENQQISDVIQGTYRNHPIRIFNYDHDIGRGRNAKRYNFTVFEITFEKTIFPHILLQSKTMMKYVKPNRWGDDKDVQIPINEESGFNLFATQNYEIEALEIFDPGFISFLKDQAHDYNIEFAENKVYIYDDRTITKKDDLTRMYKVAKKIFDSVGPLLNRLHDDFAALHTYYKK